jgi:hypothetical protein
VRVVIADTGPVNYLILIRHIDLLPRMFEKVILPGAVQANSPVSRRPRLFWAGLALLQLGLKSSKRKAWILPPAFTSAKPRPLRWLFHSMPICC